jgi:phosphate-selective porin
MWSFIDLQISWILQIKKYIPDIIVLPNDSDDEGDNTKKQTCGPCDSDGK